MSQIARSLASNIPRASAPGIEVLPFRSFSIEQFASLSATHHFSFGKHYDPKRVRHGLLRVFDDGIISSPKGIPFHPHKNIDIVSVVLHKNYHPLTKKLEGGAGLVHVDTGGNKSVIPPGNAQVMSLGHAGLSHAESITDNGESGNAFQIWLNQTKKKQENSYTEVRASSTSSSSSSASSSSLVTLASGFEEDLKISPNAARLQSLSRILSVPLSPGKNISYKLGADRLGYLVSAGGHILVNGVSVQAHDAAQISNVENLEIRAIGDTLSEVVLIDVPHK